MAEALRRVRAAHLLRQCATIDAAVRATGWSSRSATAAPGACGRSPWTEAEGGRGLWLVEQLARAWGVRPAPEGGKTAWCALTL